MSKDLTVFNPLKADISAMVSPCLAITVSDWESNARAIEATKQIKALAKQIDDARDGLVRPLNEQVKTVNAYARDIQSPLDQIKSHLDGQLKAFAIEQERVKQRALAEATRAKAEADRIAMEAERKRRKEAEDARAAELEAIREDAEAAAAFGINPEDAAEQLRVAEAAAQIQRESENAEFERQAAARNMAFKQAEFDAKQLQTKGVRKTWKLRVLDLTLVPKEFLIVELNEKMALAARAGGRAEIPGIEFYQDIGVSIGQNTYVPKSNLLERK